MPNTFFRQNFQKRSNSEHHYRILHIRNSLGIKFQPKLAILNFCTKLTQKGYFQSKKKYENHHRFLCIQISLGSKFQPQQTILIFRNKFPKQGYFQTKTEKINITIEFLILELYIIYYILNFTLNKQFSILGPNLPKMDISGQKQKK